MNCLICSDSHFEKLAYPHGKKENPFAVTSIQQCLNCGFGQADPMPSQQALNKFYGSGEYWHDSLASYIPNANQSGLRMRYLKENQLVDFSKVKSVLDIGAGLGSIGHYLPEGTEYNYNDQDRSLFDKIPKNPKVKYFFLEDINAGKKFDLIFCNHVLEHVTDPYSFLEMVINLLAPNGSIYIEVPHHDFRFKKDVFPHILFFHEPSLRKCLEKKNVMISDLRSFGGMKNNHGLGSKLSYKLMEFSFKAGFHGISQKCYKSAHLMDEKNQQPIWLSALIKKK